MKEDRRVKYSYHKLLALFATGVIFRTTQIMDLESYGLNHLKISLAALRGVSLGGEINEHVKMALFTSCTVIVNMDHTRFCTTIKAHFNDSIRHLSLVMRTVVWSTVNSQKKSLLQNSR